MSTVNETKEKAGASQKLLKSEASKAIGLIIEDLRGADDSLCNKIGDYFKLGSQDDDDCERAHAFIQESIDKLSHLRYNDLSSVAE